MRTAGIVLMSFASAAAWGSDHARSVEPPGTATDTSGTTGDRGTTDPDNPSGTMDPGAPGSGDAACAAANAAAGITLPAGFCATVFADNLGKARQIVVTPSGRVFVAIADTDKDTHDAHVTALYDANGDGVAEQ